MSDFIEMLVELLPMHSVLQNTDNDLRKVLDRTVGEYMDSVDHIYDELFLQTATGGWLDAHGKDYGVLRKTDETDDSYRERIIQEKNDRLTPLYLSELYGVTLYAYVSGFNPANNTLTSDNPYASNEYMSVADLEIQKVLNSKFAIDSEVHWI